MYILNETCRDIHHITVDRVAVSANSPCSYPLTWLQQEPLDGYVEQPSEALVLVFGAQDLALVLHHRVFNGAENLLCCGCQPVVQKHIQQLQLGHFLPLSQEWGGLGEAGGVLLFTFTKAEVVADRLLPAVRFQKHSGDDST